MGARCLLEAASSGPFKIPNSSAASDLDSLWPQAFEPLKSLLGTVHVAGGGCVSGIYACRFFISRLGDPAVAERKVGIGDRKQRQKGLRDSSAVSPTA